MSLSVEQLEEEALKLDAKQRGILATRLLQSLAAASAEEIEAAWAQESLRRIAELDSGHVQAEPIEVVFDEARAQLR